MVDATQFGQVKWFDYKKGFGFIQKKVYNVETNKFDSADIFVHFSKISNDNEYKILYPGEHVIFEEIECSDKGMQATNVRAPSNGKLMHDFKNSQNSQNTHTVPYKPMPWDTMFMMNFGQEFAKNFGNKGKGKGLYNISNKTY